MTSATSAWAANFNAPSPRSASSAARGRPSACHAPGLMSEPWTVSAMMTTIASAIMMTDQIG